MALINDDGRYDDNTFTLGTGMSYPTAPGAANAPESSGGGGGGPRGPYSGPSGSSWTGQFNYNLPWLERFKAPKFAAPSYTDAAADPGYQFAQNAGQDALEKSAAARGVLRTGGTLKDLATWNQNFASQHYNTVYNRALQAFDREYQGAKDEYAPVLTEWRTKADMEKSKALADFNAQYGAWQIGQHNAQQAQNAWNAGFSNAPD